MRRMRFQAKLSITFILLLVMIMTTTTYLIYQRVIIQQKEELRKKILNSVKLVSMLIDADKHSLIKPEITSQDTAAYKEIKEALKKIRDTDPLIDSVYTMVKTQKKNSWLFVVDSGDKKGITSYCGEPYDVSNFPQMQLAFDLPSVDKELTQDKWGVWLSGYAPIYNRQGQVVAALGLDVSAKSIRVMQLLLAKKILWVFLLGIIVSLLMSWFIARQITQPLHSLTLGAREVGRGDLTKKVLVKSRDEIQELANAFNKMTDGLREAQEKLQRNYLNTIQSLARALEAKDHYLKGHSERVRDYAVKLAKLLGLANTEIKLLEDICILHDIGKIGIPEKILGKPERLSEDEFEIIKTHPLIGEDILRHIEFIRPGISIVRDHHERQDGSGYPHHLKAQEISLLASIVAVADVFDALTSDRPYRQAFSKDEAITILKENKDNQFNGQVVETFIAGLEEDKKIT